MEQEEKSQALTPVDQQTLTFYGKPLVVVRMNDGRVGIVLRWLCDNLQLEPTAQVRRIRRTEVIADDLVYVQVQTEGGHQSMPALVLHAVPFWLAGIDPKRVRDEIRPEILRYQREVVDVLYAWASTPRAISAPAKLVPSEQITKPAAPGPDASVDDWIQYHQQMQAFLEWQRDIQTWRGHVETRLEGLEAMTDLIPEILERLGPETLSPAHQRQLQAFVKQLHETTGKVYPTIYDDLKLAFQVARYQDITESDWGKVTQWFKVQLERERTQR